MLNFNFYKNGVGIKEICITDPEIRSYLASLTNDEECYKKFALAIKLGITMLKDVEQQRISG